jgi:hypothetical protein
VTHKDLFTVSTGLEVANADSTPVKDDFQESTNMLGSGFKTLFGNTQVVSV